MKKFTFLVFMMLAFCWQSNSQSIVIGTGTSTTSSTGSDPIDGYFNAFRYQVVYTAAELSASLTPNDEITALGWSIAGDYGGGNLLGYTIKMGHTSATNSASHNTSSTIVVKNAFNYNPTVTAAGVFDMIAFDTNFVWNGIDNVLVEVCSDGQNPFSGPYGQVRVTNQTAGSRFFRVDNNVACGTNTNQTNGNRPNIQFNYIDGIPPSCLSITGLNIDNVTSSNVTVSWTPSGSSETDWEVAIQPAATGEPAAADGSGANVTSNPYTSPSTLSPQTNYEVWVRAECTLGSDFGPWVGPENFTTSCSPITPDYVADMSVNVPDTCWDEAGSGEVAAGPGGLGASDWRDNRAYAFGPSNAMNIWQTNTDREWLLSPAFDLSVGGPYQLEVNVAVTDYGFSGLTTADGTMDSDDQVQLLISTDGGATWSNLTTWNAANEPNAAGTEYIEDLTSYSGNVQFAIWASDGTTGGSQDYDFHVGKFNVNAIPSTETVDYCNLQFPPSGSITEGGSFTAFGRIYEFGRTEAAGANSNIEAWIGYSTTDAVTTADFTTPNWTWVPATFNAQFGNDDEYSAEIGSGLDAGSYFYVSRFRADNGVFAYGGNDITDGDGGNFWDGTNFVSGELDVIPAAPTTVATITINGCGDSGSYSGAYDASTSGIVWVELIYDGNCSDITIDNETTTGIADTEIGLYDIFGNLVGNDDDSGTGSLGSLTEFGLPAGTYYIASGAFNITFGATAFNATTSSTTATGTLVINASTPNVPDYVNLQFPGAATINAGNTASVFAQIFEAGNTPGAGAGTNITAEIGVSAVDASTLADFESVDWTWTTAPYFGEVGNNDEYSLAIGASLAPGTYYYVSRFSVDGGPFVYGGNTAGPSEGGDFWDGSTFVSGVLTVNPAPEPTNHVTAFAATADSDSEITLTWSDNDGTQPATGFLIVGKTAAASFYSPSDTTDPSDDTDWSDDEFEVKVASGVETYTVTGLTQSSLYDFQIYPYTNSGSLIDFKTDGTIPSASATTLGDPCASAITSFPFEEGFESGVPPQCWTSFRGTNGLGAGFDWTTSTTANSGSSSAFVRYENVTGGLAEDWLVTPALDLSGLTSPELSFFARESFGSNFGSVHSVRVSTTDTNIASFTTVQSYTENDFTTTFAQYIVDLTAYSSDTTVYIAFVLINDDGDSWFIDDVRVDGVSPVTYTYNGTWSPSDPNGTATAGDDIVIASGNATINTNTTCNSMTVNPGAGLTVNTGVTLTTASGVLLESTSTTYSSLILDGSVAGTMTYERHVNINGSGDTGSNDLVSAPLTGQPFNVFAAANPNILNNGTLYLFGPYDKALGEYVTYAGSSTVTLDPAVGYRAGTTNNGTVSFTGTANNSVISVDVQNFGPTEEQWNLIGNPYPSYINVQDFLTHEVSPGVSNLSLFAPFSAAIYGYDGNALDDWTVYNLATTTPSTLIAPGQGFFVSANATDVTLYDMEFTPAMRSTGTSDDFIVGRNAELIYMRVRLSTNTNAYSTDFYFNNNASLGFDFGYDAEVWGDNDPEFAIYSHLVNEGQGRSMMLQALNSSNLTDVTIPLGVNANQGEQLTFSIADMTLPASVNVYLEDVVANTITLLNNSDYVMTPTTDLSGTGRFFLRTSEDALSTVDNSLDALNIFALHSSKELVVSGQLQENTILNLYDIQGRKVFTTKLDSALSQNRMDVSNLSGGVYVVTVYSQGEQKTQKVILK